jgi:Protein of unknown function (DUF1566)/PEP-CTERM motif
MKLMRKAAVAATAAALMGVASTAQAALFDRGGGMIYDDTLDITWLADWNYAQTSGFDADGRMNWSTANSWANNLVYGGFDDWRLPTALNADGSGPCGPAFDCTGSEMGHMFYTNWGASAGRLFATGTNAANLALFSNVQSNYYWSGTEYAPDPGLAWYFNTDFGDQSFGGKINALYAVAVRPGDVVAVVPEPNAYALMLMGLGALMVVARRRPR